MLLVSEFKQTKTFQIAILKFNDSNFRMLERKQSLILLMIQVTIFCLVDLMHPPMYQEDWFLMFLVASSPGSIPTQIKRSWHKMESIDQNFRLLGRITRSMISCFSLLFLKHVYHLTKILAL